MEQIVTRNVWSQVRRLLKDGELKFAAIAYVSGGTRLSFGYGDVLICDASDAAVKSGETDAKTIQRFRRQGADIYSYTNLHAKALVCGKLTVVGSANLSASAETRLVEAALITTRSRIRSQTHALIRNIMDSAVPVDDAFARRILSLPVSRRFLRFTNIVKPRVKQIGNRYWAVNTRPLERCASGEEKDVEAGEKEAQRLLDKPHAEINWMRWTGNSRFRRLAKPGDTVVEITRYERTATVSAPCAILVRQHRKHWTRYYIPEAPESISWTQFERRLRRVGLVSVKKTSVRELNQREILLMESIWESLN